MQQNKHIEVLDLGLMDYKKAWEYQEDLLQKVIQAKKEGQITPNYLLFVEHPAVYTLGKSGKEEHVLLNETELAAKEIQFFRSNRGGDITYHGPGQIVGYPIFDLENFKTDIGWYLRTLEQVIMDSLKQYAIIGERSAGETGVWIDANIKGKERKICAMGVRCSRWVTMHGFALNVNTNLDNFNFIIPCGITDKKVTSMQMELKESVSMEHVKKEIEKNFKVLFV
jgi:lipoyl(octanoyl) transferase